VEFLHETLHPVPSGKSQQLGIFATYTQLNL